MGRSKRHTVRSGDGGAEMRLQKKRLKEVTQAQEKAELTFYDDPSSDDEQRENASETASDSEFGDDEEVLQLDPDGDEDDEEEEDDEDGWEDEEEKKRVEKMGSKWGSSKRTFYSADTVDDEDDEAAARDEETAALELQRKQNAMMETEDFGVSDDEGADEDDSDDDVEMKEQEEEHEHEHDDADNTTSATDESLLRDQLADLAMLVDEGDVSVERVAKDYSQMTKNEKLQIVDESAPELIGLTNELQKVLGELRDTVKPAILKLRNERKRSQQFNRGMQYLVSRQNLLLNYAANISFYLLMRAEGKTVVDHPVLEQLLELKKMLNEMQPIDSAVAPQMHKLLHEEFPQDLVVSIPRASSTALRSKAVLDKTTRTKKTSTVSADEKEAAAAFYEAALREKQALQEAKQQFYSHEKNVPVSSDEDDSDGPNDGKRGASYEIIKNKGLKAHKSKLNRNPRVKKRMQYRKAVIRRKGQVRDVRTGEASRYGGETTGIKSNLSRSRKIRS